MECPPELFGVLDTVLSDGLLPVLTGQPALRQDLRSFLALPAPWPGLEGSTSLWWQVMLRRSMPHHVSSLSHSSTSSYHPRWLRIARLIRIIKFSVGLTKLTLVHWPARLALCRLSNQNRRVRTFVFPLDRHLVRLRLIRAQRESLKLIWTG